MSENTHQRPSPGDFDDYRAYLRAMVAHLKATRSQFSYRWFSRRAGFSSPNFLKLVAEGQRNLSPRSIGAFATGLGLDERETEMFEALVQLDRARTDAERNRLYERIRRVDKSKGGARQLQHAEHQIYSWWYALVIRELTLLADFREDSEWIARRLHPRIRPSEARKALSLLEQIGLLERGDGGRLRPLDSKLATRQGARSLAIRNFHREMIRLAGESLDGLPVDTRDVSSVTLTLTRSQFEALRARVAAFRREALELLEDTSGDSEHRDVYQLNFQLFPVTRGNEDEEIR